jgi:hypothetical protein
MSKIIEPIWREYQQIIIAFRFLALQIAIKFGSQRIE